MQISPLLVSTLDLATVILGLAIHVRRSLVAVRMVALALLAPTLPLVNVRLDLLEYRVLLLSYHSHNVCIAIIQKKLLVRVFVVTPWLYSSEKSPCSTFE
jgi:hypothetical protein